MKKRYYYAEDIAEILVGTDMTIEEAVAECGDFTMDEFKSTGEYDILLGLVFQCDTCHDWFYLRNGNDYDGMDFCWDCFEKWLERKARDEI